MFSFLEKTDIKYVPYTKDDIRMLTSEYITKVLSTVFLYLKKGEEKYIKTAIIMLDTFLDNQNTNPDSPNFGLWDGKHNFTPQNKLVYDRNSTTHIGIPMFTIFREYSDLLPGNLVKKLKNSLSISCLHILDRNIHMQSTHIVIAEAFLTAVCGEYLHNPEFLNYSINVIRQFYHYTLSHGSFTEYNSISYDINSLYILNLSKKYIKNEIFHRYASIIEDMTWKNCASHYHFSTGNFTGPSQRIYIDDGYLKKYSYFVESACKPGKHTSKELNFRDICPKKYKPYFDGTKQNNYIQQIVSQGSTYPYFLYSHTATTLLNPNYAIGTFNRGECWDEQASFLGNFGTKESPFFIKVTAIHDGFDFASAQLSMIQDYNYVIGHTTFATNRGDRHIEYDKTYGTITAKDLRIRFSVIGDSSKLILNYDDNSINIRYMNTYIKFRYTHAEFDNSNIKSELNTTDNLYFDLVLYHGRQKKIDFTKIKKAIVSWAFCISDNEIYDSPVINEYSDKFLITKLVTKTNTELKLISLYKPDTHENIHTSNRQFINGNVIEKYILMNMNKMHQYAYVIDYIPDTPFEINLGKGKNITEIIRTITSSEEDNLIPIVKKIFSELYKNNVTLSLIKRTAIQIISHVFEYYREKNVRFEMIISENSQTYQLRISSAPDSETVAFYVFELLKLLHSHYVTFSEIEDDVDIIKQIISIIDEEYSDSALSLEYIAEKCEKSIYTVSRAFKKISNLKYIDYLTNIRMNHAKEFLKNPEYSLEEVALKSGYLNLSSFIRTFKKKTGETPGKYRNSID